MLIRKISFLLLSVSLSMATRAQNSPFSQYGLGNFNTEATIPQQSMGELGVSNQYPFQINQINPALLPKIRNVIFEAGYTFTMQDLESQTRASRLYGGNLGYLSLAFPVSKNLTTSIGLRPYSVVEYELESIERVPNTDFFALYEYKGSGGMNSFYISNGYQVKLKKPGRLLYLGAKINVIFGNITDEASSRLIASGNNEQITSVNRQNISDAIITPALGLRWPLANKNIINAGVVIDLPSKINSRQFNSIERRINEVAGIIDTLIDGNRTRLELPSLFRAGISYEKPNNWLIGVDASSQAWSSYKGFGRQDNNFFNALMLSLGGEFTPRYNDKSYFKRITYRAGVNYRQTPLNIEGNQLNETNLSVGFSLPIGDSRARLALLHLGVVAGQRGDFNKTLVQERFVRFMLGVSLNDLSWFNRPKID